MINNNMTSNIMMNDIYRSYVFLKVRMKINFNIAIKKQTLQECWLNAILKTYFERDQANLIEHPYPKPKYKIIDELTHNDLVTCYHYL